MPARLVVTGELPLLGTGKVDYGAVAHLAAPPGGSRETA